MISELAGTEEAERLTKINTQMSRTMFNKSSVTHNIISNSDNFNNIDFKTGKRASSRAGNSILAKKPHNYKKSIGNFIDVETANNPHVNQKYKEVIQEDNNVFKKINGMCTFYTDAQVRQNHIALKPPLRAGKKIAAVVPAAATPTKQNDWP